MGLGGVTPRGMCENTLVPIALSAAINLCVPYGLVLFGPKLLDRTPFRQ